jgi:hypothetical protein
MRPELALGSLKFIVNTGAFMTLTLHQTHTPDLASTSTAQEHHLKAAGHLDSASMCHKETAKLMQGGDHHAASSQAKLAAEHTAKAADHVTHAAKRSTGQPATTK